MIILLLFFYRFLIRHYKYLQNMHQIDPVYNTQDSLNNIVFYRKVSRMKQLKLQSILNKFLCKNNVTKQV